ncbi:Surfeit locus protein 6 -like protein [Halotydeus destructor]|nr:Surfeit locus protein 6 -like protein [Halotydeus destructor]
MSKRKLELQKPDLNGSVTEAGKSPLRKKKRQPVNETPVAKSAATIADEAKSSQNETDKLVSRPESQVERLKLFDQNVARIIDFIPPKVYFQDEDFQNELQADRHAKADELAKEKKLSRKLSKKEKHKMLKLNRDSQETVSQIIKRKFGSDEEEEEKEEEDVDGWGRKEKLQKDKSGKMKKQDQSEKKSQLQKELSKKISDLKTQRKADSKSRKKLVRETKKERRENNRRKPGSKQKNHVKQNRRVKKEDAHSTGNENDGSASDHDTSAKSSKSKVELEVPKEDGKLIFSKFDLVAPPATLIPEKKAGTKNRKALTKLLNKTEKHKSKIADLESSGKTEEAHKMRSEKQWQTILARSEGEKVRDNPTLIKKSIKKLDDKKKKSAKKWEERKETLDEKMKHRIDKRQRNLDSRKKANKDRKLSNAKKRGRIIQ